MEQHHEAALNQALDQLYLEGAVSIPWVHLYLWFNAQRLNKFAYREIVRLWAETCERYRHEEVPELRVLTFDGPTLNLRRDEFEGEEIIKLADWT